MQGLDPDQVLSDVGRRIAELRAGRGWTQEALAERLGVSAKYLQGVERGTDNLTLRTLVRVAQELGTKPIALLRPPIREAARTGRPRRESMPFEEVEPGPGDFYRSCVPLVTLEVRGGGPAEARLVEIAAWVTPHTRRKLGLGMFVARVSGDSMEPTVPRGCFGLFRSVQRMPSVGTVVLAARTDDGETTLVLTRLAGSPRHLHLASDNPTYPPVSMEGWTAVGELVEALGA